jgi:hypothetical protein
LRSVGLILVAILLALPSMVRATQHVSASRDSAPIRLNRGFDQPQARCRVAPPGDHVVIRSAVTTTPIITRAPCIAAVQEPIPVSPSVAVPDPLRGPPSTLIS